MVADDLQLPTLTISEEAHTQVLDNIFYTGPNSIESENACNQSSSPQVPIHYCLATKFDKTKWPSFNIKPPTPPQILINKCSQKKYESLVPRCVYSLKSI